LKALGIDPKPYFKRGFYEVGDEIGGIAGYMLDRKKDAALIERLRSMTEPHVTRQ
jgi:hypothetical protein